MKIAIICDCIFPYHKGGRETRWQEIISRLREHNKKIKIEVVNKLSALITAGFGLVAALAWNDTIKAIVSKFFGSPGDQITAMIVYALIITLVAVMATVWIGRIAEKAKN